MSINNQIKNQEKDPVCGMFVIVNSHTIQTHIRGKNYYFCNPNCLKTFLKPEKEFVNLKKLTGFSLILCSLTLLINFSDIIFNSLSISTLISKNHLLFIFSTPVQFISGNRFYKGFIHAIKARTANMDVFIVIGSSTAWLYSTLVTFFPILIPESSRVTYFDSGVVIITFLLLGKVLEHTTKNKTKSVLGIFI